MVAWAIPAAIGAAGALFSKGKKAEVNPYGSLNPEQVGVNKQLGSYLQSQIGQSQPMYTGEFYSPLGATEQAAIDRNARLSALGEEGLSTALRGEFPEEYFQQAIYKPMLKQYQEDVQPLIEEQYAGPGGYWGSARANAVSRGYRDLYDTLTGQRAQLGWQARQAIPQAVTAANSLASTEASMQSIPRIVRDNNLTAKYNEWVRTRPESQRYIDQALNFLGQSTGTYTPAQPSMFEQLLPELIKAGAAFAMKGKG